MELSLKARTRTDSGKGVARKARAEGYVPGVLYGVDVAKTTPLLIEAREMQRALSTEAGLNVLVNLEVDGSTHFTMLREVQRDILRGDVLHVDFFAIDRDTKIEANVPVHLVGEARGVKEGGVVEHHLWELHIKALPTAVPNSIDADITELGIDDHLTVSQIPLPEGVEVLDDPDRFVVSVVEPQIIELPEEMEPAEGEELEEGEVPEGEEAAAEGEEAAGEADEAPSEEAKE